jgi:hypothetical protein
MSVLNDQGNTGAATGIQIASGMITENVRIDVLGEHQNLGIYVQGKVSWADSLIANVDIKVTGGIDATGIFVRNPDWLDCECGPGEKIMDSAVSVHGASRRNVGIESSADFLPSQIINTDVVAEGGEEAIAGLFGTGIGDPQYIEGGSFTASGASVKNDAIVADTDLGARFQILGSRLISEGRGLVLNAEDGGTIDGIYIDADVALSVRHTFSNGSLTITNSELIGRSTALLQMEELQGPVSITDSLIEAPAAISFGLIIEDRLTIMNSVISGTVEPSTGPTIECVDIFDGDRNFYPDTCTAPAP